MAYDTKHLRRVLDLGGVVGGSWFVYDTVDALATIYASGYISDALEKGMQKGDVVIVRRWTTTVPAASSELKTAAAVANILVSQTLHNVIGIATTGDGTADLTDGLAITITNT